MESKKPLTLDDLALLMQQGFASVHAKVDTVKVELTEQMDERFDAAQETTQGLATHMNEQFKGVNERLDVGQEATQGLATHMDERFDALMPGVASKDFVERKAEAQSTKTHVLVNILKTKNVLTPQEATDVIRA